MSEERQQPDRGGWITAMEFIRRAGAGDPGPESLDDVEDRVDREAWARDQVSHRLEPMSDRERKVLMLRFGVMDGQSRTQEEVAREIGRSARTARRIEKTALWRLRHPTQKPPRF